MIELSYCPITELNGKTYVFYLTQPSSADIAKKIIIEPLESKMKNSKREEFDFDDFKVTKTEQDSSTTSWERVYSSLMEFLKIRADDSRAKSMNDVKPFEGIGYCILIPSLMGFIEKRTIDSTSPIDSIRLSWPQRKKGDKPVREIIIPEVDYSVINTENAKNVLRAKRFCGDLEREVVTSFKDKNKTWFEQETKYSLVNLPKKEESPVKRTRKIDGKYIFISLVREEKPKYKEIIECLTTELLGLEQGAVFDGYKTKKEKESVFINIKNVLERLSWERLEKDGFIKVGGRYEIVP